MIPEVQAEFVSLNDATRGYLALPQRKSASPAVLVYMEAYGVNAYVQGECRRLAAHGFVALAPDFYHGEAHRTTTAPLLQRGCNS